MVRQIEVGRAADVIEILQRLCARVCMCARMGAVHTNMHAWVRACVCMPDSTHRAPLAGWGHDPCTAQHRDSRQAMDNAKRGQIGRRMALPKGWLPKDGCRRMAAEGWPCRRDGPAEGMAAEGWLPKDGPADPPRCRGLLQMSEWRLPPKAQTKIPRCHHATVLR